MGGFQGVSVALRAGGAGRVRSVAAALAAAVAIAWIWASPAQAVSFIACDGTVAAGVSPNAGCTGIADAVNDNETVMNTAPGAFGLTDWTFLGRDNLGTPEIGDIDIWENGDIGMEFISGTFSFDSALVAGYTSVALVLKSAASANPCAIVAYLMEPGQTSGSFSSPFLCDAGNQQEISHFTLYGDHATRVPLPLSAVLLLSGLAFLGGVGRRRAA